MKHLLFSLIVGLLVAVACSGPGTSGTWTFERLTQTDLERAAKAVEPTPQNAVETESDEIPLFGGMAEEEPEEIEETPIETAGVAGAETRSGDFEETDESGVRSDPRTRDTGVDIGGLAAPAGGPLAALENVTSGLDDSGHASDSRRNRTWKRSPLVPHRAKLEVGDDAELPLEATNVTVRVDGFRARVAVELFYRNDKEQRLHGTLRLRLPDGASPDYTAFGAVAARVALPDAPATSVAGLETRHAELKQARMVPRARAARAYTDTVRENVDPALVEWAGAGVYNVRVFPLEPGKLHQISIAYDVDLQPDGGDLVHRLELPEKTGALQVAIEATGAEVNGATSEEGRFSFENPPDRVFETRVKAPGNVVLTGSDGATGPLYAARLSPAIPDEAGDPAREAIFLVDTSLSSNPDRLNVWLELMQRILERNRATLKRYRVGFFDVSFHWWRDGAVDNTEENAKQLAAYAQSLVLEGATDLSMALSEAARIDGRHDLFLLSDGAITWGEGDAAKIPIGAEHTLFAYRADGGDAATLSALARRSGGALFDLSGDTTDLAVAHTKRPWRLAKVDAPGDDVLVRGSPDSVYPGQTLVVCGRGAWDGDATLHLEQGGKRIEVRCESARSIPSELTASTYGQVAVAQLEDAGAARESAQAYAQHFRVVGKTCSLVMLESEEDYASYGIVPQDDAGYVQAHPTAPLVASSTRPANPLRAWLSSLEFVTVDGALARALERADPRVADAPVAAKTRLWSEIPGAFTEQLAARKTERDSVEAEAERRRTLHGAADGLKALSSRIEQSPGDWDVARDVAYTALDWGEAQSAYHLFRRVAEARPYEPQNFLGMARSLEAIDRLDLAAVFYEVALAGKWDGRFGAFRRIATVHYLAFLRRHPGLAQAGDRLEALVPGADPKAADLVVTMFWNTDSTDVDLHLLDPLGDHCFYGQTTTRMGGSITADVTTGFGPEMFVLEKADPGAYAIWAHYFSEDRTRLGTRTKVFATIIENFGRADERTRTLTIVLEEGRQEHPIGKMVKSR